MSFFRDRWRKRDLVFTMAVVGLCVGPPVLTVLFRGLVGQVPTLGMERRVAERFPVPSLGPIMDGTFQSRMERSLADQLPRRYWMVMARRRVDQGLTKLAYLVRRDLALRPLNGQGFYDNRGQLVYYPARANLNGGALRERARYLAELAARWPGVRFHVHHVRSAATLDFLGRHLGIRKSIEPVLAAWVGELGSAVGYSETCSGSLAELRTEFYNTDHHWAPPAAYAAYVQLVEVFELGEPLPSGELQTIEGVEMEDGSLARRCAYPPGYSDGMTYYRPPLEFSSVRIDGVEQPRSPLDDYLLGGSVKRQTLNRYSRLFGDDFALVTYERQAGPERRLLLMGDSMTQAMERWLAWHFRETHVVDVRHWAETSGAEYDLEAYLKEHRFSHVVWLGGSGTLLRGQDAD